MKAFVISLLTLGVFAACSSKPTESTPTESTITTSVPETDLPVTKTEIIGKGTVISFTSDIHFKNPNKRDMVIRLPSDNNKDCSFSMLIKKGKSYSLETGKEITFDKASKATSPHKHTYTIYSFNAPGGKTIDLACTDRTELSFKDVTDAWEFRGASTVTISNSASKQTK